MLKFWLYIILSMRNTVFNFLNLIIVCFTLACAQAQQPIANKKVLIVYLSRTNNTKAIAEIIHANVGGQLVALELEKPYPADYKTIVEQVANENERDYLPALKTKINGMEKYDTVFIGFPTWGMKLPPPIKTFLKKYNLSGKTLIPFNTNAGYGIGSSFETIKELCQTSKILKGFQMQGGIERDGKLLVIKREEQKEAETKVKKWLNGLSIKIEDHGNNK